MISDCDWRPWTDLSQKPTDAFLAGTCSYSGVEVFVARILLENNHVVATFIPKEQKLAVPYKYQKLSVSQSFEVLIGTGFFWSEPSEDDEFPENAVPAGSTSDGFYTFIGRTISNEFSYYLPPFGWNKNYRVLCHPTKGCKYEWKTCNALTQLPHDVVKAGPDVCVGRIIDGESRRLVSVNLQQPSILTKSNDNGLESSQFQVLTGAGFCWSEKFERGQLPKDAVLGGRNLSGEMCFIGRKKYKNEFIVGEISTTKRCMFLVHNSDVVSVTDYEVLRHPKDHHKQALLCIPLQTDTSQTFKWIDTQIDDFIPEDAFLAIENNYGHNCYVGRFWNDGEVLPAMITIGDEFEIDEAIAVQNNKILNAKFFQILTGSGLSWQTYHRDLILSEAIETGKDVNGESLLIGRGSIDFGFAVGKILPSHACSYLVEYLKIVEKREFDVLSVHTNNDKIDQWLPSSVYQPLPENSVFVGFYADGSEIYAGRSYSHGEMKAVNILPTRRLALTFYPDSINYEVLVGTEFAWVDYMNGQVPANTFKLSISDIEGEVFFGRVQTNKCLLLGRISPSERCICVMYEGNESIGFDYSHYQVLTKITNDDQCSEGYRWVPMDGTRKTAVPPNIVPNKESAASSYVGRFFHKGDFLPAAVSTDFKTAVATYENSSIISTKFELLSGKSLSWEKSCNGEIPAGAVASGKDVYGEWLFIGRCLYEKNIGKVYPSLSCIYKPYGSRTNNCPCYEVLVQQRPGSTVAKSETNGKCCICCKHEATMAVMPCGDLCMCHQCCEDPKLERCPICHGTLLRCIKIFKN